MSTPRDVIATWTAKMLSDPRVADADVVCKLEVKGTEGGDWLFHCKHPVEVREGGETADCTITIGAADFLDMASGKLNPQVAYLLGKIEVSGDTTAALRFAELIV